MARLRPRAHILEVALVLLVGAVATFGLALYRAHRHAAINCDEYAYVAIEEPMGRPVERYSDIEWTLGLVGRQVLEKCWPGTVIPPSP